MSRHKSHKRTLTIAAIFFVVSLAVWACGKQGPTATSGMQSNSAQSNTNASGDLHFKAPDGWVTEKASSSMRVAQYKLPKAEGDNEPGNRCQRGCRERRGSKPRQDLADQEAVGSKRRRTNDHRSTFDRGILAALLQEREGKRCQADRGRCAEEACETFWTQDVTEQRKRRNDDPAG